jgi:hypothetical protein
MNETPPSLNRTQVHDSSLPLPIAARLDPAAPLL